MLKILFYLTVILLNSIGFSFRCLIGEILIENNCIKCEQLPYGMAPHREQQLFDRKCDCQLGFNWNKKQLRCQKLESKDIQLQNNIDELGVVQIQSQTRLLQTSCNYNEGFILYSQTYVGTLSPVCFNCRLIPGSSNTASDRDKCGCIGSMKYIKSWGTCYAYTSHSNYYDVQKRRTYPCASLPTQALINNCIATTNQFFYTRIGKVYCSTIKNSVFTTSCSCAVGYRFSSTTTKCQCAKGYYRDASQTCVKCPTTDNTMCSSTQCNSKYIHDGFSCVLGSLLGAQINGTCNQIQQIFKRNPYDNRIIGCVCSINNGYFKNGQICTHCSNISILLLGNITQAECSSCSLPFFAKGLVQCVYCASIMNNLDGSADASGCKCQPGYFWNINTAKCQCDYADGMILIGQTCFDCKNIIGSQQFVFYPFDSCTCKKGLIWNSQNQVCDCDTSGSNSFAGLNSCINCQIIIGGNGKTSGFNSCDCLKGYKWNNVTEQCQCDHKQNFILIDNTCRDCKSIINSNGIATQYGECICLKNYKWNQTDCVPCSLGSEINIAGQCVLCSSLFNSSECISCDNSVGYGLHDNTCYECSTQYSVLNSNTTDGLCTCPQKMVWEPTAGGCVCKSWTNHGYIWTYNQSSMTDTNWTCQYWGYTNTNKCNNLQSRWISKYKICHLCRNDPNNAVLYSPTTQTDYCKCKPGYILNLITMPFGCTQVCDFNKNFYIDGDLCKDCNQLPISGIPQQNDCLACSAAGGFILRVSKLVTQCFLCSSLIGGGTTGIANQNGCVCESSKTWNPKELKCQ